MADTPKLNNAQQLAALAAKARKAKESQVEGLITNIYPQLKARAQTAASNGDVNMIISSVKDETLFRSINNPKGLQTLKDNGFTVNVTQLDGAWVLDIYWDSGDPSRQTVDTST